MRCLQGAPGQANRPTGTASCEVLTAQEALSSALSPGGVAERVQMGVVWVRCGWALPDEVRWIPAAHPPRPSGDHMAGVSPRPVQSRTRHIEKRWGSCWEPGPFFFFLWTASRACLPVIHCRLTTSHPHYGAEKAQCVLACNPRAPLPPRQGTKKASQGVT